jgi:peroxiredoxin
MNQSKLSCLLTLLAFLFFSTNVSARDGYKIGINFTDVKTDAKVMLCHYFGKGGTVFKDDSVTLKKGVGIIENKKKIEGGIYLLYFADKSSNMEIILMNGDNFSFTAEKANIASTIKLKGKSENNLFYGYQRFLVDYGKGFTTLKTAYAAAKTKKDSTTLADQMQEKGKELINFRKGVIKKHPKTFLATLFKALAEPDVPKYKDWPMNAEGKKDSTYPSLYYKKHYWDGYDFQDDRLIFTPMYEPKLKNYMDKWVVPMPDTVIKECDAILKKAEGAEETFKYSLWYLTRWAETSKIMGMEEVFVYLVEEYYMKDKATWLKPEQLKKYIDRAQKIAPNMIGKPAMDLRLRNMRNEVTPLSSVNANYTLLIFYDADCGHCKKELPRIDSLYKRKLYQHGLVIMAVETTNIVDKWKKFVTDQKLNSGWIHAYDPDRSTNFRDFYDVIVTPTIYLLDKNKKIIGRRINHTNILDVIEFNEKKRKEDQTKN